MTRQQQRCLEIIRSYIAEHNVPPSYQDIAEGLGLASKSGVARIVDALIVQGRLTRSADKVRNLALVERNEPLRLRRKTRAALDRYCLAHGERPGDVVDDAVRIFLDGADTGEHESPVALTELGRAAVETLP